METITNPEHERFYDTLVRGYIYIPRARVVKAQGTTRSGLRYYQLVGTTAQGRKVVKVVQAAEWEAWK